MRSAPASATTGKSSRVIARSGSPAVTNGMNALRFAARNDWKSVSIGFMQRFVSGGAASVRFDTSREPEAFPRMGFVFTPKGLYPAAQGRASRTLGERE